MQSFSYFTALARAPVWVCALFSCPPAGTVVSWLLQQASYFIAEAGEWSAESQVEGRTHEVEPTACGEITVREALQSAHSFCLFPTCATTVLQAPPSAAALLVFSLPAELSALSDSSKRTAEDLLGWHIFANRSLCSRKRGGSASNIQLATVQRSESKLRQQKRHRGNTYSWAQNKGMFTYFITWHSHGRDPSFYDLCQTNNHREHPVCTS